MRRGMREPRALAPALPSQRQVRLAERPRLAARTLVSAVLHGARSGRSSASASRHRSARRLGASRRRARVEPCSPLHGRLHHGLQRARRDTVALLPRQAPRGRHSGTRSEGACAPSGPARNPRAAWFRLRARRDRRPRLRPLRLLPSRRGPPRNRHRPPPDRLHRPPSRRPRHRSSRRRLRPRRAARTHRPRPSRLIGARGSRSGSSSRRRWRRRSR